MLLISCSDRKILGDTASQSAMNVYDGVFYRLIKNAFKINARVKEQVDIYILSAKYNLIPGDFNIEPYDQKMDRHISLAKRELNTILLKQALVKEMPKELIVAMGKTYRDSIDWNEVKIPTTFIIGEIGIMQSKLKKWLLSI